jgi:hypothetical protein
MQEGFDSIEFIQIYLQVRLKQAADRQQFIAYRLRGTKQTPLIAVS